MLDKVLVDGQFGEVQVSMLRMITAETICYLSAMILEGTVIFTIGYILMSVLWTYYCHGYFSSSSRTCDLVLHTAHAGKRSDIEIETYLLVFMHIVFKLSLSYCIDIATFSGLGHCITASTVLNVLYYSLSKITAVFVLSLSCSVVFVFVINRRHH